MSHGCHDCGVPNGCECKTGTVISGKILAMNNFEVVFKDGTIHSAHMYAPENPVYHEAYGLMEMAGLEDGMTFKWRRNHPDTMTYRRKTPKRYTHTVTITYTSDRSMPNFAAPACLERVRAFIRYYDVANERLIGILHSEVPQ